MFFANPTYLWALLGVLVPIGIHLWSRREAHTVRVGSIQFLEESESVQSRALKPSEWWLLLLRAAIVALLALLLAGPRLPGRARNVPVAYVVEPGLLREGGLLSVLDSLGEEADVRLLQPGLPAWEGVVPGEGADQVPGYWQLVPALDSLQADSIVVFSRGYRSGLRSRRPASSKPMYWVVMEESGRSDRPLLAFGDQEAPRLITLESGAEQTNFSQSPLRGAWEVLTPGDAEDSIRIGSGAGAQLLPLRGNGPLEVVVASADSLDADRAFAEAALKAVSGYLEREIPVSFVPASPDSLPDDAPRLIWLSGSPPPDFGGRLLFLEPDPYAGELINPTGENRYRLTARLNADNTLSGHFTQQLLDWLLPPDTWKELALKYDRRQLQAGLLQPERLPGGTPRAGTETRDLSGGLWLALCILLAGERLLALKRRQ